MQVGIYSLHKCRLAGAYNTALGISGWAGGMVTNKHTCHADANDRNGLLLPVRGIARC